VIAFSYRGGRYCAGLLACTVVVFFYPSIAPAATNGVDTTLSRSRDEKSALASLALQLVGQIQSQQQATLQAVEESQRQVETSTRQNAESIRSLLNRLRIAIGVGILLTGGLVAVLFYVRALLQSVRHRPRPFDPLASTPPPGNAIAARLTSLLAAGDALLDLKQPARALVCFDEVLALDDRNARACVKRGTALEQLGRLDEALVCYDQAIALDASLTDAYVGKGSVYNRLERYGEALEYYEKAARLQPTIDVSRVHSLH
jgi:tetratricopeptide (TPR) repeat protein